MGKLASFKATVEFRSKFPNVFFTWQDTITHIEHCLRFEWYFFSPDEVKVTIKVVLLISSGDKDDDDDDDADDKMQSSVLTGGEEGRQGSQDQSEVDHGDFEMVVRKVFVYVRWH